MRRAIHTPGGLVLAAEQIAQALHRHRAEVTVMVPHYAMSGGTLIAFAADRIQMAPSAVLGPVDPQLGQWAAASILAAVERKTNVNKIDDQTLIMTDLARKAQDQVRDVVFELLTGTGCRRTVPTSWPRRSPRAGGPTTFPSARKPPLISVSPCRQIFPTRSGSCSPSTRSRGAVSPRCSTSRRRTARVRPPSVTG